MSNDYYVVLSYHDFEQAKAAAERAMGPPFHAMSISIDVLAGGSKLPKGCYHGKNYPLWYRLLRLRW